MQAQSFLRRPLRVALAAVVLLAGAPAVDAADPNLRLEWRCAQGDDEDYNVLCVPLASASDQRLTDDERDQPRAAATNAPPRRKNLLPVAMRSQDEIFAADGWYVPLYGPPTDLDRVRELLRRVLCGRHADCTVEYEGNDTVADARRPLR
jgi:hypothetical protein